jgi:MinD superfamily P-loop ATPase
MIISIASGKGGTGKTTVAVGLALSLKGAQFIDSDVEEPNAHIFIKPTIKEVENVDVMVPEVDYNSCNFCGKCAEFCQYNAIFVSEEQVLIFPDLCHNCGGCEIVCPEKAIREYKKSIGRIERGKANGIEFLHGVLDIAQLSAVPVIKRLKNYIQEDKTVIIDSPPGTSCTMIESIEGSDFCILVTEPTPFGLNDLNLAVSVVKKMNIKYGVVINQSDIGDDKVREYCLDNQIDILMEIPFKREVAEAYSRGESLISVMPEYESRFRKMYEVIEDKTKIHG